MAAILNVRAVVGRYRLSPEFRDALLVLFDPHVAEIPSTTRISKRALSIKTQEYRATAICKAFVELREGDPALAGLRALLGDEGVEASLGVVLDGLHRAAAVEQEVEMREVWVGHGCLSRVVVRCPARWRARGASQRTDDTDEL